MSVELLRSWIQLYAKPLWCSNAQTSLLGPTQYAKKKKKWWGPRGEVRRVMLYSLWMDLKQSESITEKIYIYVQTHQKMSRKGTHQKKKTLQEQDQSGKVVYTLQTNNKISLRWRAALHRLNFPYLRVTVSHSVHLFAPHLSQFLSLPFSLSWGLIAGLTDSVEEQCVANMRRKRGVCVIRWARMSISKSNALKGG